MALRDHKTQRFKPKSCKAITCTLCFCSKNDTQGPLEHIHTYIHACIYTYIHTCIYKQLKKFSLKKFISGGLCKQKIILNNKIRKEGIKVESDSVPSTHGTTLIGQYENLIGLLVYLVTMDIISRNFPSCCKKLAGVLYWLMKTVVRFILTWGALFSTVRD